MLALLAVQLFFSCSPAPVRRGERVECTARLVPRAPFAVVERVARAEGQALRDPSVQHAESSFSWAGTAAVDTEVSITVRTGADKLLTAHASFQVVARTFPRLALGPALPAWEYGDDTLFGGWPPRIRAGPDSEPLVADGALGVFAIAIQNPRTRYIEDGPNARWFYVEGPVPPPKVTISVHRALRPGDPFYALQTGGFAQRTALCGGADLDHIRDAVLRHEGAAAAQTPSHFGQFARALEARDLQAEVEALHVFYADELPKDPLDARAHALLLGFIDAENVAQRTSVDGAASITLRCRLRYP